MNSHEYARESLTQVNCHWYKSWRKHTNRRNPKFSVGGIYARLLVNHNKTYITKYNNT